MIRVRKEPCWPEGETEKVEAEQSESVIEYWSHLPHSQPLGTKASLCLPPGLNPVPGPTRNVHWAMTSPWRRKEQNISLLPQSGAAPSLGSITKVTL